MKIKRKCPYRTSAGMCRINNLKECTKEKCSDREIEDRTK